MKNLVKILTVVMITGSLLVGCGGTAKPDGTYTNEELSFNFGSDSVIVSEGDASVTCDYEMDSEGTITFELEGDEMTLTYDADHDVINYDDDEYIK